MEKSQKKLDWVNKQCQYWYEKTRNEYNAHAETKLEYYSEKAKYWKLRIDYCENPDQPTREEIDALAQMMMSN